MAIYKRIFQIVGFIFLAYIYLYVGYHLKEYLFDFSSFSFIINKGINSTQYISSVDQFGNAFEENSRWLSTIFTIILLMVTSSLMVWVIFLKKRYFVISCLYYMALILLSMIYVIVFSLLSESEMGYQLARFIKDNFIHTPFVFVILVASLKIFKI